MKITRFKTTLVEVPLARPIATAIHRIESVGCVLLVLQPIGERTLRPPASRWIAWPASLWMGFAFLVLVQLLVSDGVLWLAGSVARAATAEPGASASTSRLPLNGNVDCGSAASGHTAFRASGRSWSR